MNGIPMPTVYPLDPWDPQAAAFLSAMMTRLGMAARPAEPAARGWLDAYGVARCSSCSAGVVIGSRCRQCGGPQ